MKKTIRIRMTNERCEEITGERGRYDLALPEVEIDLDALTPAARWIAEHITSTYVIDEYRDVIGIKAIAGFTMAERDRRAGKSEEYVKRFSETYGNVYAVDPMTITEISFPIYGKRMKRPEDVIEFAVNELRANGAVKLVHRNGNEYML